MFRIVTEGEYALFTRPEMKVERMSYDIPTPSALVGLLKSIFWKPAIEYCIDKIVVFNPIRFTTFKRNELSNKVSAQKATAPMRGGEPLFVYASEERQQRSSTVLINCKYGIEFHFDMTGIRSDKVSEDERSYTAEIARRIDKGQFHHAPCLGCREFLAKYVKRVDDFNYNEVSSELKGETDLGYMLYCMKYHDDKQKLKENWDPKYFSDNADAVFYRPKMIDGVIDVAKYKEGAKW